MSKFDNRKRKVNEDRSMKIYQWVFQYKLNEERLKKKCKNPSMKLPRFGRTPIMDGAVVQEPPGLGRP